MNLSYTKREADRFFCDIMKCLWFLLAVLALYILFISYKTVTDPAQMLGSREMLFESVRHLLAGCAGALGLGALIEYLT